MLIECGAPFFPDSNEKPFKLDMPYGETLRRCVRTDAKELPEGVKLREKQEQRDKKKAGRKKPPDPPKD